MTTATSEDDNLVEFTPVSTEDDTPIVTESQLAVNDIKAVLNTLDAPDELLEQIKKSVKMLTDEASRISNSWVDTGKEKSDGSTASYYELPKGAMELQELISFKDMNAQMGEIFRAVYRYGQVEHSEKIRDAKKIKYYIEAEIARLEKYESK